MECHDKPVRYTAGTAAIKGHELLVAFEAWLWEKSRSPWGTLMPPSYVVLCHEPPKPHPPGHANDE